MYLCCMLKHILSLLITIACCLSSMYGNVSIQIVELYLDTYSTKLVTTSRNILQIKHPSSMSDDRKAKKTSILDLTKYIDKAIRVKFSGGREVAGVLKGFDHLLNIVLDNCTEFIRDPDDPYKLSDETRTLGIVVCRGTAVVLICPVDGMEAIANPFLQQES